MASYPSTNSIEASPELLSVLTDLHAQAAAEPQFQIGDSTDTAIDKFVALDTDKSAAVYLLLRSTGARHVIEAGTSFGVSTIYLALAVGQNVPNGDARLGKVIATEMEATKAVRARENWKRAGPEVEPFIELREGDLLQTLKTDLPTEVDFLLLDIWTPLALPTLKLVLPHLKKGGIVLADNTEAAKEGYQEFLDFVNNTENGLKTMTLPFSGGFQLIVKTG